MSVLTRRETAMLKSVLIAMLAFAVPCSASPIEDPETTPRGIPRVRPHDTRSASLLLDGIARSATMRRIVDELERLNVIVYIEMKPGLHRQLAGQLAWVTAVKNFRYVRISLSTDQIPEVAISVLGHELRHALEVAHAPSIVDERSLEAYYREHGMSVRNHTSGWDTQVARDTGELVRREIAETPARLADARLSSSLTFDEWQIAYRRARDRFGAR